MSYDFCGMLKKLLISEEYNYSNDEADRLIKTHSNVIIQGIMSNNLNATAMALQMADEKSGEGQSN